MSALTRPLYDAEGVRALDRNAIEGAGIPGLTLMRRAGAAAFAALCRRWPRAASVDVLCGTGNNGGDGFVIAELAQRAGLAVRLMIVGDASRIAGDAASCLEQARAAGVIPAPLAAALDADCVVDAVFGTGLDRPPAGDALDALRWINAARGPRLAVDLPSGLDASTGATPGEAVVADLTVTFIGLKCGLLTAAGPSHCGELVLESLDVPARCFEHVPAVAQALDYDGVRPCLPRRARTAHKGDYGHVLVVGGAPGMGGAGRLASAAAARTGAGLVSLATHPHSSSAPARDEIMVHAVAVPGDLRRLADRATIVAVGPGLGTGDWGAGLFATLRDLGKPLVVDADALNLLAADAAPMPGAILTPHPGEAARLLAVTTAAVQADRLAAARELAERYAATVILKGAGSIVATRDEIPTVVCAGNPGMASGGMGDVLTGIVAALLAQGHAPADAARIGACVHGHAADLAADAQGERGLLAGDVVACLQRAVNPQR